MDPAAAYALVSTITSSAVDVRSGWDRLVQALAAQDTPEARYRLEAVDVESDVASVHRQLLRLVQRDPPPEEVDTLWFGLFDAVDEDGVEIIGYYVAGVRGFDRDDPDSRCSPAWWPEGRYLESATLAALKHAELEAGRRGAENAHACWSYAGQLGGALLVSRFAAEGLPGSRQLVVGFDSGDFVVVGE